MLSIFPKSGIVNNIPMALSFLSFVSFDSSEAWVQIAVVSPFTVCQFLSSHCDPLTEAA